MRSGESVHKISRGGETALPPPDVARGTPPRVPPAVPPERVSRLIGSAGGLLAILAMLIAAAISMAQLVYSKADESQVDELRERLRAIEVNDVRQTVLLERIDRSLEEIKRGSRR